MGIPPDDYPVAQEVHSYAGSTAFDVQSGGRHVRYAEIRGAVGEDVVAFSVNVVPPKGEPSVPLCDVRFGIVHGSEPQILVGILTPDGSPIADGYQCQFTFQSVKR